MNLKIDPRGLPLDGQHYEGSLPASVFALSDNDQAKATTPLDYSLDVVKDGKDLIVTGEIAATFQLECGRCTQPFLQCVHVEDYAQEVPLENEQPVDLTNWLREDILLALPTYPRCENGNVDSRECPAEGSFENAPETVIIQPHEEEDKVVWGALDQLKNLKSN